MNFDVLIFDTNRLELEYRHCYKNWNENTEIDGLLNETMLNLTRVFTEIIYYYWICDYFQF